MSLEETWRKIRIRCHKLTFYLYNQHFFPSYPKLSLIEEIKECGFSLKSIIKTGSRWSFSKLMIDHWFEEIELRPVRSYRFSFYPFLFQKAINQKFKNWLMIICLIRKIKIKETCPAEECDVISLGCPAGSPPTSIYCCLWPRNFFMLFCWTLFSNSILFEIKLHWESFPLITLLIYLLLYSNIMAGDDRKWEAPIKDARGPFESIAQAGIIRDFFI